MKKISGLSAPALAGVVREKSVRSVIAAIRNCVYGGADMIDLHMSCLEDTSEEALKAIISSSKLPVLALNYNLKYDWSSANYTEEDREALFLRAVSAGAAGIDIQGYTYDLPSKSGFCGEDKYSFTKGNPKEVVTDERIIEKQCALIEHVHSMGAEVLLSCHPAIAMTCEQIVELALFLEKRNPDIIKIVTIANTDEEMLESIKAIITLKKEVKTPVSYHAGGSKGTLTRILNPVLGSQIAFCVDGFNEASTLEQLDLRTAKIVSEGLNKILC